MCNGTGVWEQGKKFSKTGCKAPKERQQIAHCKGNHEVMSVAVGSEVQYILQSSEGATAHFNRLCGFPADRRFKLLSPFHGLMN